ncbi:MAG: ABC transporter permease, partial [Acidobacteriota bacterium]
MPERHREHPPSPGRLLAKLISWLPDAPRRRWLEPSLCELQAEFLHARRASASKTKTLARRMRFQICVFRCLCSCLFWTAADGLHSLIRRLPSIQEKNPIQDFAQDLRYAFRALLRKPGFSVVCLALLALGIGASTSIFSVVEAVLLNPVPFPQPDRLYALQRLDEKEHRQHTQLAYQDFVDLRQQGRSFQEMAAVMRWSATLGGDVPHRVEGFLATASLFPLLGIEAHLGRTFLPEEEVPGRNAVVMLSHRLWSGRFGSDPSLVGGSVWLDGKSYTVAGILPPGFRLELPHSGNDFWLP